MIELDEDRRAARRATPVAQPSFDEELEARLAEPIGGGHRDRETVFGEDDGPEPDGTIIIAWDQLQRDLVATDTMDPIPAALAAGGAPGGKTAPAPGSGHGAAAPAPRRSEPSPRQTRATEVPDLSHLLVSVSTPTPTVIPRREKVAQGPGGAARRAAAPGVPLASDPDAVHPTFVVIFSSLVVGVLLGLAMA